MILTSRLRYALYGALASASLVSLSVQAGPNDGVFGDYFTNMTGYCDISGTNSQVLTGLANNSDGEPFGTKRCTSLRVLIANIFALSSARDGQAMLGFDSSGNPKYGSVNWQNSAGNISYTGGNVGIGTTTPGAKLEVAGSAKVTGPLVTNDTIKLGNTIVDYFPNAGNWNYTLQLNAQDTSSIGFHDAGNNVGSIRFKNNLFTIGADDGWGVANTYLAGNVTTNGIRSTNGLDVGNAGGTYTYITLRDDESPNGVKYIHANNNNIGFLSGNGGWLTRWDDAGNQVNTANITANGNITVGTSSSRIFLNDTDESWYGPKSIHANYNVIGFLGGQGSWLTYWNVSGTQFDNAGYQRIDGDGGWMRTYGATGWYNGTYGVGMYATQAGYVQTYNSAGIIANSFVYASDRRLKKNITPLTSSLEKILSLNGYSFDWINDGKHDIGVIAQEVEKVFPAIVNTNPETGMKAVEYGNLVAPMIEAIKELANERTSQAREIQDLRIELNELKVTVQKLVQNHK